MNKKGRESERFSEFRERGTTRDAFFPGLLVAGTVIFVASQGGHKKVYLKDLERAKQIWHIKPHKSVSAN